MIDNPGNGVDVLGFAFWNWNLEASASSPSVTAEISGFNRLPPRRHGRTAPCSSDFSGSATINPASRTIFWPRPWQTGQAPNGELNEKCFGVSQSKLWPVAGL